MSNVLVVAEIAEGAVKKPTYTCFTFAQDAAKRIGGQVHALAVGSGAAGAAEELKKYAATVHVVENDALNNPLAEAYAQVVVAAQKAADAGIVCAAATVHGKDLLPRCAALLGAGMASDILGFAGDDGLAMKRPVQAGNVVATVEIDTDVKLVTTRPTEFAAAEPGAEGTVAALTVDPGTPGAAYLKFNKIESERPDLGEARVIVGIGRGIKDEENIKKLIEPMADKLQAAIGASRAVVDAGWVPNDLQVGQTGKVVAPELYFAIGISGAIQHVAGMKSSKTIVAINKDEEAPIFEVADYGMVEDLFKILPDLIEKL